MERTTARPPIEFFDIRREGRTWAVVSGDAVIEGGFKTRREADTRRDYLEADSYVARQVTIWRQP